MPKKSVEEYNVARAQDGAVLVCGVPLDVAESERDRLNENPPLHLGELAVFEVVGVESGLVVA